MSRKEAVQIVANALHIDLDSAEQAFRHTEQILYEEFGDENAFDHEEIAVHAIETHQQ